jgi:hypothetical protein
MLHLPRASRNRVELSGGPIENPCADRFLLWASEAIGAIEASSRSFTPSGAMRSVLGSRQQQLLQYRGPSREYCKEYHVRHNELEWNGPGPTILIAANYIIIGIYAVKKINRTSALYCASWVEIYSLATRRPIPCITTTTQRPRSCEEALSLTA